MNLPDLTRREMLAILGGGVVAYGAARWPGWTPSPSRAASADPLHYASLSDVARRIEAGELSPTDLTELLLDRIAALPPASTRDRARQG